MDLREFFKTALVLSAFGSCLIVPLLLIKPVTVKKLSAKWQYCVWIAVLAAMVFPAYKLVPARQAQKIAVAAQKGDTVPTGNIGGAVYNAPAEYGDLTLPNGINLFRTAAYIWIFGVCVFLLTVFVSYAAYMCRKRKNSAPIAESSVFDSVKNELNIRRNIKIRMSADVGSPMLAGVFFPTVYIPCREIPADSMRMVLLHELMHYKRKDLLIKWLAIFVNAVHWFNPLCYLACANLSQACEVSCDMAVTKNMSEAEQKLYMRTILDLVEEGS